MLTRLPSVSKNETYWPTPGISIGSPRTLLPASVTLSHRRLNVVDGDDDGRMLRRPMSGFFPKSRAKLLGAALVRYK
jgi:hypothetical protein